MRDLRDAKPGEVYRDRDGDVWVITEEDEVRSATRLRIVGHDVRATERWWPDSRHVRGHAPFVRLVPEEREEW